MANVIDFPQMPHMEAFTCTLMYDILTDFNWYPSSRRYCVIGDWFAGLFTDQIGPVHTQSLVTAAIEVDVEACRMAKSIRCWFHHAWDMTTFWQRLCCSGDTAGLLAQKVHLCGEGNKGSRSAEHKRCMGTG
jgi:hypothetical protein